MEHNLEMLFIWKKQNEVKYVYWEHFKWSTEIFTVLIRYQAPQ